MDEARRRVTLDDRLDVPMSSELKSHLTAIAVVNGYRSTSEYVRDALSRIVYGELSMIQRYRRHPSDAMGGDADE